MKLPQLETEGFEGNTIVESMGKCADCGRDLGTYCVDNINNGCT